MHYYKFNIKDWSRDTAHLSVEEEGVYRRLLDHYYESEMPIPVETQPVIRRLRLGGHEAELSVILGEFFTLESDGYRHKRCDDEIAKYHAKAESNRVNGKKGGRPEKPKVNPDGFQMEPTNNLNHKPLTTNQEPVFKNTCDQQAESQSPEAPKQPRRNWVKELAKLGVDEKHAKDWMTARKQKKSPMTDTALEGVIREAAKAGITLDDAVKIAAENSWVGFKASWMDKAKTSHSAAPVNRQQQIEDANARVVQEIIERESRLNGSHGQSREMFDLGDPITIEGEVIHAQ